MSVEKQRWVRNHVEQIVERKSNELQKIIDEIWNDYWIRNKDVIMRQYADELGLTPLIEELNAVLKKIYIIIPSNNTEPQERRLYLPFTRSSYNQEDFFYLHFSYDNSNASRRKTTPYFVMIKERFIEKLPEKKRYDKLIAAHEQFVEDLIFADEDAIREAVEKIKKI